MPESNVPQMEIKTLGSTRLRISPIGIGLAALGRPGYINIGHADDLERGYGISEMENRAHAVLDAAYARGVRYFDAARSYGRAEAFLGSWLRTRGIPAEAVTVGSKWGYRYTANWKVDAEFHEIKEHSLKVLQNQYKDSIANLGLHLDLYQIHSATLESGVLENREVLGELAELKREGVAIGLSVSGPRQSEVIERAIDVEVDGERLFDTVQASWNLLERSAGAALSEARASGMGVIVKEALANGRLTDRNPDPGFSRSKRVLEQEAKRLKTTLDRLAIAAVLARPWADIVLSGAAKIEHLQSNVKSAEVKWDEQAEAALKGLTEPAEVYWETRSRLPWN